jgi:mannose-1-phosphate guanylyltransferase
VTTEPSLYAVILAGGGGTRLWPLSRQRLPKHLLPLHNERTLLSQTYARVQPLIAPDHLMVITVAEHAQAARDELPTVPASNFVIEPEGRGTGPCVGLMAALIRKRDPAAVMISLHADHAIEDQDGFRNLLRAALEAAQAGHLVTLGVVPTSPETGYGYIERGERLAPARGQDVYRVRRFTEKPDLEKACSFVDSGCYFWNSGIFVWQVSTILEQFRRLQPQLYAQLMEIEPALGTPRQAEVMQRMWPAMRSVSIDVGIMERADDVVVIPAKIGWSDVGCWSSVACLLPADGDGNVAEGEHVALDCQGTYIHSSHRLVAALGLRDMVIIETEDAVLVCPKDRAQEVKQIVEKLRKEGREQYL